MCVYCVYLFCLVECGVENIIVSSSLIIILPVHDHGSQTLTDQSLLDVLGTQEHASVLPLRVTIVRWFHIVHRDGHLLADESFSEELSCLKQVRDLVESFRGRTRVLSLSRPGLSDRAECDTFRHWTVLHNDNLSVHYLSDFPGEFLLVFGYTADVA